MKPDVLMVGHLHPSEIMDRLGRTYRLHDLGTAPPETRRAIRALVTTGRHGASAALMDELPGLELIACFGVGVDAIDVNHAAAHGIQVTNTPDVLTDDVADAGVALWMALLRRIVRGDRLVRRGDWARHKSVGLSPSLSARRTGFLGFGRIGRKVAMRLAPWAPEVAYCTRHPVPGHRGQHEPDLIRLATWADDLFVCCIGGATTNHLVNRQVIEALGPEGTLINIARGSVVDESALVAALLDGQLGGAALDVYADEPNVPSALTHLDNVIVTPHLGSATRDARRAMGHLVIDNLDAYFSGQPLKSPVMPANGG